MSDSRRCDVCGAACGSEKGQKTFAIAVVPRLRAEVVICRGCAMRITHSANGSYITKDAELTPPALAFPRMVDGNRIADEYLKVARDEGWRVGVLTGEAQVIDAHYKQALMLNHFRAGEGWHKDVQRSQLENFRRSCRAIRQSYASWLAFTQE